MYKIWCESCHLLPRQDLNQECRIWCRKMRQICLKLIKSLNLSTCYIMLCRLNPPKKNVKSYTLSVSRCRVNTWRVVLTCKKLTPLNFQSRSTDSLIHFFSWSFVLLHCIKQVRALPNVFQASDRVVQLEVQEGLSNKLLCFQQLLSVHHRKQLSVVINNCQVKNPL